MSELQPPSPRNLPNTEPNIAVALSGGGHRAALFGLGVLLYLVDSGMNRRVDMISSVSGGSITNGFVSQHCDFREVTKEDFDTIAFALLHRIVRQGLYWSWLVWTYFAFLAVTASCTVLIAATGWPVELPWWAIALLALSIATIGLLRGMIVSLQFTRLYFQPEGHRTRLQDLSGLVEHVFCSTDLNSNAPFYFSSWDGGYVYSPAFGFAKAGPVTLGTAVRASAAFPGGIPPKRFTIRNLEFHGSHHEKSWQVEKTRDRILGEYKPRVLFLADGGVWNNLGTQSLLEHGIYHGPDRWTSGSKNTPPDLQLIVANASAPVRPKRLRRLHLPGLAEFSALSRSVNILTFNTVEPRINQLREHKNCVVIDIANAFDRALCTISIPTLQAAHPEDTQLAKLSPDFNPRYFAELRLYEELVHEGLSVACTQVPTTLGRIDRNDAARLLIHGYQNAQAELYVKFGYPRVDPRPFEDRFTRLIPVTRLDRVKNWFGEKWFVVSYTARGIWYQMLDEIKRGLR
ncbi:patatin-like phospholipase family protein [Petrachloros mirabilis]